MNYRIKIWIWFILIGLPLNLLGQTEQILINPTNPQRPGKMIFDNFKGSINVVGYNGNVVIVDATLRSFKNVESVNKGLKKVQTNPFKLTAEANDNEIFLTCESNEKTVDFNIKVPYNFSLKLQTYDNGKITVQGIIGNIEVTNINGDIILEDISGSVIANTIDGNIKSVFKSVNEDSPMAFTSVQGSIEVFLPSVVNAIFKMKSDYGEIFSNFDITYEKRKPTIKQKNGKSIITLDDWTVGKVNSGGSEFLFSTHDGNIYITKR